MKWFFLILTIVAVTVQVHAQEQVADVSEEFMEDEAAVPVWRDYKAEMGQLFTTYNQEKDQLEKEYTGRINAMNPEMSDVQGMLDKQNLIQEFKSRKKDLLKTYRDNNNRLKLEEKAFKESQLSQDSEDEEEYEDDEEFYEDVKKPAVPTKKNAEESLESRRKRAIKPYEETKGYKKKPQAKAKKKSSYILKDNKPKVKRESNIKKGLLNKNSNKHNND
ncbi:MAG: hypothetical protein AB7S78_03240 [Candidatus Omnitrophota bacterium]